MNSDNLQKISDNRVARLMLSHYGETKGGLAERLTQRIANPCLETRTFPSKTRPIRVVGKSDNRPERFVNVSGMLTTAFVEDAR